MKKDLSLTIKLASYGSILILTIILFITGIGIYSLTDTQYEFASPNSQPNFGEGLRYLKLVNTDFSALAGTLGVAYFFHTMILPVMKTNRQQENNERDVILGYLLVAITYIIVGVMGSIGFIGYYFNPYF